MSGPSNVVRSAVGVAVLALAMLATPGAARAQGAKINIPPGTLPAKLPNTASVTIGGTFAVSFTNPPLVVTGQQANPCSPGECLTGTATVRANNRWMLQVRLASPGPTAFYVNLLAPTAPYAATRLTTTAWTTVAQGTTATTGQSVTTYYNANKSTTVSKLPTAAEVAAALQYQVIALP